MMLTLDEYVTRFLNPAVEALMVKHFPELAELSPEDRRKWIDAYINALPDID